MSYIAFQYAEALFAVALEDRVLPEISEEFSSFLAALDEDIFHFLLHPKVTNKQKKEVLKSVTTSPIFRHFLFVLIDNSRVDLLTDIHTEFGTIVNNQNNTMDAIVFSPKALTTSELTNLQTSIGKKHNRTVTLTNVIDASIVGGVRIEYDGHVIDKTINHYLDSLRSKLTK